MLQIRARIDTECTEVKHGVRVLPLQPKYTFSGVIAR